MRPHGTAGWAEDQLAALVTPRLHDLYRHCEGTVNGAADLGRMMGFGPVVSEPRMSTSTPTGSAGHSPSVPSGGGVST
jgi:hypothetical protein